MKTLSALCVALSLSLLPACLADPGRTLEGDVALSVQSIAARDDNGNETPLQAIVRQPVIELATSVAIDPLEPPVFVLEGVCDADTLSDFDAPPMRAGTQARRLDVDIAIDGTTIRIDPREAFRPGAVITVVVATWAIGAAGERWIEDAPAFTATLQVSDSADAGASAIASWPAHGAAGVAPNLAFAVVAFDGALSEIPAEIVLHAVGASASVITDVAAHECASLGLRATTCLQLTPRTTLALATHYTFAIDETFVDATGHALAPWSARFTTAAAIDHKTPTARELSCTLDEHAWTFGCALIEPNTITLRIAADEAFMVRVEDQQCLRVEAIAFGAETSLVLDNLNAAQDYPLVITLTDAAGNTLDVAQTFTTRSAAAPIAITEVRADPIGTEPAQEYVELLNFGTEAIDLQGFSLTDDAFDEGDVIEQHALLHPGGRALLVADDFDPFDARDVLPAPGATLVRIGASLASAGLSNSGEPLYLRDPLGARISFVPRIAGAGSGVCLSREGNDEDGLSASFVHDANATCTPGL